MEAGTEPGDFDTWEADGLGGETDVVATQPVTEGRAARRRQRARWKKSQRRAVVATAVALVSGSVAMVAVDQPGDRARAAAAPEEPGVDLTEELTGQYSRPAAKRSEEPRSTPSTSAASERAGRHADAGSARAVPSDNRTDTAAQPRVTQARAPQQHTAPSVGGITDSTGVTGGGSNTVTEPVTPPAPTTPPASDDGTGSQPPTAQEPVTEPDTRDPKLCVLVICLG